MLLFLRAGMQFSGIMVCLDAVVHACTPTATSQQGITDQQSLQSCLRTGQPIEKRSRKKRTLTSHRLHFCSPKWPLSHITFESKSWYEIYIVQLLKGIFFLYYFFIWEICDLSSLSWAVWLLENLLVFQEWSKRSLERSIDFWKLTRLCIKFVKFFCFSVLL